MGKVGTIPTTFIPQPSFVWIELRLKARAELDQYSNQSCELVIIQQNITLGDQLKGSSIEI